MEKKYGPFYSCVRKPTNSNSVPVPIGSMFAKRIKIRPEGSNDLVFSLFDLILCFMYSFNTVWIRKRFKCTQKSSMFLQAIGVCKLLTRTGILM